MPLLDGLIGYWSLNEASGNRADSHTSALTLTDFNTVGQLAVGKVGAAADFVRANNEYLKSTSATLNLTTTDSYSVSVWILPTAYGDYSTIVNDGASGNRKLWLLLIANTGELARWSDFLSGVNVTPFVWSHIVYTFVSGGTNTGTERFYINGSSVATRTGAVPAPGSANFWVGGQPALANMHNGQLDELGFWRRELVTADVTELYNGGAGLPYSSFTSSPPSRPFYNTVWRRRAAS